MISSPPEPHKSLRWFAWLSWATENNSLMFSKCLGCELRLCASKVKQGHRTPFRDSLHIFVPILPLNKEVQSHLIYAERHIGIWSVSVALPKINTCVGRRTECHICTFSSHQHLGGAPCGRMPRKKCSLGVEGDIPTLFPSWSHPDGKVFLPSPVVGTREEVAHCIRFRQGRLGFQYVLQMCDLHHTSCLIFDICKVWERIYWCRWNVDKWWDVVL